MVLQLSRAPTLRIAVRNDCFPNADHVISMSREFGVPLTAEDLITGKLCHISVVV